MDALSVNLSRMMAADAMRVLRRDGLTQFATNELQWRIGPLTPVQRTSLSRALECLEAAGWIRRLERRHRGWEVLRDPAEYRAAATVLAALPIQPPEMELSPPPLVEALFPQDQRREIAGDVVFAMLMEVAHGRKVKTSAVVDNLMDLWNVPHTRRDQVREHSTFRNGMRIMQALAWHGILFPTAAGMHLFTAIGLFTLLEVALFGEPVGRDLRLQLLARMEEQPGVLREALRFWAEPLRRDYDKAPGGR